MFVNYFGSSLAKAVRDGLIEQNPFLLLEAKEFAPQGVFHSGCGKAKWKGREYGATSEAINKSAITAIILLVLSFLK